VAVLARQWWQLVACLAAGGLANALLQPATNLAVARGIPTDRQGLAFGLKLMNGPTATLLAGLSASLIATTVGWRWAFVTLACLALVFFVVRPPGWRSQAPYVPEADDGPDAAVGTLALIAVGCAFATTAGASLVGFYVESAVAGGLSVSAAGFMLVAGSVVGTVARAAWGWLVDGRHSRGFGGWFGLTVLLLVVGGLAFVLLGVRAGPVVLLVATVLAFAAGWGWPGLLLFSVVRASPSAPGKATGIVIVGTSSGGVVGPAVFGFLVERAGYVVAWQAAAVAVLLAAVCIGAGAHLIRRRDRAPAAA
jgi:MFS family permease